MLLIYSTYFLGESNNIYNPLLFLNFMYYHSYVLIKE